MTYYFVTYEHRAKDGATLISNIILRDTHPLTWAADPPMVYQAHFTTTILFWTEIPADVAESAAVQKYFSVA